MASELDSGVRSWSSLTLRLGSFLLAGGASKVASAEATLEWVAPAVCPRADAVHRRIELQLGHPLSEAPSNVRYFATVSGDEASLRLGLQRWEVDVVEGRSVGAR